MFKLLLTVMLVLASFTPLVFADTTIASSVYSTTCVAIAGNASCTG